MTFDKDKNPPAFPYAFEHNEPPESGFNPGMSLRDYFAAKFAGAYCSSMFQKTDCGFAIEVEKEVAGMSYALADAMLAEIEKKGGAA